MEMTLYNQIESRFTILKFSRIIFSNANCLYATESMAISALLCPVYCNVIEGFLRILLRTIWVIIFAQKSERFFLNPIHSNMYIYESSKLVS